MDQESRVLRREPRPRDVIVWEPSARRVRGLLGPTTVVDSRAPVLVWEPGSSVPLYAFPAADVRLELLAPATDPPTGTHAGATVFYDLLVDGTVVPNAAWRYPGSDLGGHLAFEWFARVGRGPDRWYEEDEEIVVHPRDPYVRVDALPSSRHVVVRIGGSVVADSVAPVLVFETGLPTRYYLPAADVVWDRLTPSRLRTGCPYKGVARYWTHPGVADVAWSYPDPVAAVGVLRDLVAFFDEAVDVEVDGVAQERPRTHFR
jgi:uncharacterized protein (DUF427 family)